MLRQTTTVRRFWPAPRKARAFHTATLLGIGKVLVAGGSASGLVTTDAELFDPATGTWTATGEMKKPRNAHAASLLGNGRVLVAGGSDGKTAVSSAET